MKAEAELVVVNVYIYVNGRVRNGMVLFSIIFRLLAMFGYRKFGS